MKNIRLTTVKPALESTITDANNDAMDKWIKLSIEELEFRSRYSKPEETQVLQGALRVLYDIQSFT